ncbi:hypothetical protein STRTUCAR8_06661 [Streptomyces turgidiscabies Car8]|uniref:Uncharacterized protein n=1 Tax=Streptomyces turgidiscabies (strain Car8) TaxID=698760 RepID=L7EVU7_STRT8|nr:hypothetical protein STRTUCAR8_06661 [Streptomyces turgidiscabies Car8]
MRPFTSLSGPSVTLRGPRSADPVSGGVPAGSTPRCQCRVNCSSGSPERLDQSPATPPGNSTATLPRARSHPR